MLHTRYLELLFNLINDCHDGRISSEPMVKGSDDINRSKKLM